MRFVFSKAASFPKKLLLHSSRQTVGASFFLNMKKSAGLFCNSKKFVFCRDGHTTETIHESDVFRERLTASLLLKLRDEEESHYGGTFSQYLVSCIF